MKRCIIWIFVGILTASSLWAETGVRIAALRGDVRVRRGMEESWSAAGLGMLLRPLDTVWSGEASELTLELDDRTRFILGSNAMLDIADLRRITERQMFLFLMAQKVGRMPVPDSAESIHIVNVSVVRGSEKRIGADSIVSTDARNWIRESNGAKALLSAGYHTNAVVKFYTILKRYPSVSDDGEIQFCLGRSFEALKETGRALDAYQSALEQMKDTTGSTDSERKSQIEAAIERLRSKPN